MNVKTPYRIHFSSNLSKEPLNRVVAKDLLCGDRIKIPRELLGYTDGGEVQGRLFKRFDSTSNELRVEVGGEEYYINVQPNDEFTLVRRPETEEPAGDEFQRLAQVLANLNRQ